VRLARRTLAVLVAASVVAGCGSYTKHDFIARADAICASTLRQTRLIAPPAFTRAKGDQLRALASYAGDVLPLAQSEVTALRGLRRPTQSMADKASLAAYLTAFDSVVGDYRDLETAASKVDAPGVAGAEAALRASPVAALAARYGLRTCGTAGATTA
jgi:hypothetical protein